jgi:hypothetical protein
MQFRLSVEAACRRAPSVSGIGRELGPVASESSGVNTLWSAYCAPLQDAGQLMCVNAGAAPRPCIGPLLRVFRVEPTDVLRDDGSGEPNFRELEPHRRLPAADREAQSGGLVRVFPPLPNSQDAGVVRAEKWEKRNAGSNHNPI